MTNFNFVAPFYDGLVRLVFGRKLWDIQKTHLTHIRPTDQVLVAGGGTGKILKWLPTCQVTYLELSRKMLERAKAQGDAQFIQADFLTWETDQRFDWIICPFFLDCFDEGGLNVAIENIQDLLSPHGKLIVVDFKPPSTKRQSILLKLMHTFFRIFSSLESKRLADIHRIIQENGFESKEYSERGMTFSAVYCSQS